MNKLDIRKQRDDALIEKYCSKGSYMDDKGTIVGGVCKPVPMEKLLNTLHSWDAVEDEVEKK